MKRGRKAFVLFVRSGKSSSMPFLRSGEMQSSRALFSNCASALKSEEAAPRAENSSVKPEFKVFAAAGVPHPCCVPSKQRAQRLLESRQASAERVRVRSGSTEGMVRLDGGRFLMGTDSEEGFPADGEGPVREVFVDPFYIDIYPVTNERFAEFVKATGYRTESERLGWSFVFQGHIPKERYEELVEDTVPNARWWCKVKGADWLHPEGPDSSIENRAHYPVVHVSWNDCQAFCEWAGKRLPTEAEWEYAARGGLEQKQFPWGDEPPQSLPDYAKRWQTGPEPVARYAPNGFGLYDIGDNVHEWCSDWYDANYYSISPDRNPQGPDQCALKPA